MWKQKWGLYHMWVLYVKPFYKWILKNAAPYGNIWPLLKLSRIQFCKQSIPDPDLSCSKSFQSDQHPDAKRAAAGRKWTACWSCCTRVRAALYPGEPPASGPFWSSCDSTGRAVSSHRNGPRLGQVIVGSMDQISIKTPNPKGRLVLKIDQ
jgi:hypothetical protein